MASRTTKPHDQCPSEADIDAFEKGDLSDARSEEFSEHLANCGSCESTFVSSIKGDTDFWKRFKLACEPQQDQVVEDELRRLKELARSLPIITSGSNEVGDELTAKSTVQKAASYPKQIGQFEMVQLLGQGGMGAVFKAVDRNLDCIVALKLIRAEYLSTDGVIKRFNQEKKLLGKLEHPNIVRARTAGESGGFHYLAMDYVDGLDLVETMGRMGPLSASLACEVMLQSAIALQYIHERGQVHRDIKPTNLMLSADGRIVVLDLGLAQFKNAPRELGKKLTESGIIMGTVDYLSPEQARNSSAVDIRADIYSLGCTIYHLLCGHPPFFDLEKPSHVEKIAAHLSDEPPPIRQTRSDVPVELEKIVLRMLEKQPDKRFQTPEAIVNAAEKLNGRIDLVPFAKQAVDATRLVEAPKGDWPRNFSSNSGSIGHRNNRRSRTKARLVALSFAVGFILLLMFSGGAFEFGRGTAEPANNGEAEQSRDEPSDLMRPTPEPGSVRVKPIVFPKTDSRGEAADGLSYWRVVEGSESTIDVSIRGIAMLELGELAPSEQVTLEVDLKQLNWKGGIGLYFGSRVLAERQGPTVHYQRLELLRRLDGTVVLMRSRNHFLRSSHGGHSGYDSRTKITNFDPDGNRLKLQIRAGELTQIQFNGANVLDDLPIPLLGQTDVINDASGAFGLFCSQAQARFTNIRINGKPVRFATADSPQ